MSKLIASTYRVNAIVAILEGILATAKKAVNTVVADNDFETIIGWKAIELAQANIANSLLTKIALGRNKFAPGQGEEAADREVVAMLLTESWKLAMATQVHNSTNSSSNLVNEAKIELGRKLLLGLGLDSYYLTDAVAAAILDDIAPLSK